MKLTEAARTTANPPETRPQVITIQGREVGEVYQDEYGWGYRNYATDFGADHIDSKRDAIEALMWDLVERG